MGIVEEFFGGLNYRQAITCVVRADRGTEYVIVFGIQRSFVEIISTVRVKTEVLFMVTQQQINV